MTTILIYLILYSFYTSQVIKFQLSEIRGISFLNISIIFLLITWAIKSMQTRRLFRPNNLNIYLLIMIAVALNSTFIKIILGEIPDLNLRQELLDVKSWCNPFIIFFCIFNLIETQEQCKQIIFALIFFIMITVIPMMIEVFGLMDFSLIRDVQPGRSAGFAEANQYASFLVLFIPLFLTKILYQRRFWLKFLYSMCFLLVLVGLFVTGSRGGTLAFIFSTLSYIWMIAPSKRARMVTIIRKGFILLVLCSIAYLLAPDHIKETVTGRFNPHNFKSVEQFSSSRTQIFRNGWILFLQSPIYGHGLNTFIKLMQVQKFDYQYNSHNDYLLHLVHFGIIGLTAFILIFIHIYRHVSSCIKSTDNLEHKAIYISYLSGFLGYAFAMFFVNYFSIRIIFWIYTAVIYKFSLIKNNN